VKAQKKGSWAIK